MEKIQTLRIVAKHWETADTATFTLEPVDGLPFTYRPGQFLSLLFDVLGKEKRRAYSMSSCMEREALPSITVKRVPNGEFSNWLLLHAEPGMTLRATEASGRFLLPDPLPATIFYIAAGSGITPVMSHLKYLLQLPKSPNIVLYYANRDAAGAIFKGWLDRWADAYRDRFELLYFFSRDKQTDHALPRHLNNELLYALLDARFGKKITAHTRRQTHFYLCAPSAMIRMATMTLRLFDFPLAQIHQELFQAEIRPPTRAIDPTRAHTIVVKSGSQPIEFQCFEGETILNAALRQQIALPYSCKSGVCFTCLVRCTKGMVDVVYAEQTRREGPGQMVNTCIGYAVSERVELELPITHS